MQDFEIKRYNDALAAFAKAFEEGFAQGEKELAAGAEKMANVDSVTFVDVPRDNVMDGEWQVHVVRFREAGRWAALAKRRTSPRPKLDASEAREDSRTAFDVNMFRWFVILNPLP